MARRIALLHFTAEPCIGGVEHIIEVQRRILRRHGLDVCLVAGAGGVGEDVVRLPDLRPPPGASSMPVPEPDAPDVRRLVDAIAGAVSGCDSVWIHNALTVYLNPALTVALLQLVRENGGQRWVAFCHDLTPESAYWRALSSDERHRLALPSHGITYAADSAARRSQIVAITGLSGETIKLIPLPLDTESWLNLSVESVDLVRELELSQADPLLLVPAKLLPHKNLTVAIRAASALRRLGRSPRLIVTGPISHHQPEVSASVLQEILGIAEAEQIGDAVAILGAVGVPPAREVVRDLMCLADLVLLPSTEEGYGLPLLEAIALRTPVLCSDIPSFREIGEGYARLFSLDASPERIALIAHEMTASRNAQRRRAVLWAMAAYEQAILELLPDRGA